MFSLFGKTTNKTFGQHGLVFGADTHVGVGLDSQRRASENRRKLEYDRWLWFPEYNKRGLFLGLALLMVLGITAALFAYEYLSASREFPTLPNTKWATVTEELPGPDWPTVLHQNMGEVPQGKLFRITPRTDYNGDLVVNVYLANVDALNRAYRYLNMKIYVEESVEALMTPHYRILALDNGVATFHLEGLASNSHLVSIIGGSYSLIADGSLMRKEDWAITPEFYSEVTPR